MPQSSSAQQHRPQLEDEQLEALFSSVFGDSNSDPDDDEDLDSSTISTVVLTEGGEEEARDEKDENWEMIKEVAGLWLCRNFLSDLQQQHLLGAINSEGWFANGTHNQAMRFGDLPGWALEMSSLIRNAICSHISFSDCSCTLDPSVQNLKTDLPFPRDILWREPLFDQMIVNCYQPGEGICAHVDLLQFEDGIAIISLESSCIMHFNYVAAPCQGNGMTNKEAEELCCSPEADFLGCSQEMIKENGSSCIKQSRSNPHRLTDDHLNDEIISSGKVPVLLMPGDLILMSREARYNWTHEINRKECYQVWNGQKINQGRRISITLRRLTKSV